MSEMQRIEPRDNQVEAHGALVQGLVAHDRVQAHMCCGSGKTFSQAFLAREMIEESEQEAPVVVCFVPNRDLIRQNAANFRKVFGDSVDYLGVCTRQERKAPGGEQEEGEWQLPLTTDREEIQGQLARGGKPTIIFSTYQSAETSRDGLIGEDGTQAPVLLGLFDEAHRTAGEKNRDSQFAFGLFQDNMEIEKRAFFTATPRISEGERESREGSVISMTDPEIYGPKVYEYPFSQGIKDGNVVDYDLWTPVITPEELGRIGASRGITDERELKELLAELAISKVMEETGQARFLTYHRRIADSKAFAGKLEQTYGPQGFTVGHIDGSTPSDERSRLLTALKSGSALVTNCKAFVEGVDAPGLQGIAFVDPKSSVVDIVQAIGRATRTDPEDEHKRASIIVPLVYDPNDARSPAEQAKDQGFGTLIQVVQALGASDDKMAEQIRESSREAGREGGFSREGAETHNLKLLGLGDGFSAEDLSELGKTISVISLTASRDKMAEWVGRLEAHLNEKGEMPTTKSDPALYRWVQKTRIHAQEGVLDEKHAAMLDEITGWSWLGPREKTEGIAQHLKAFYERNGRMPSAIAKKSGERELGQHLRNAEKHELYGTSEMLRKQEGKRAADRATELAAALSGTGLLFKGEEVPADAVSGRIARNPKAGPNEPEFLFHPTPDKAHRGWMPVFRTGLKAPVRPIGLHLGEDDKARVATLDGPHSVSVSIERAGRDARPFMDGRITGWHAGSVDRGDKPGKTQSVTFFVNRLKDRKLAGRPEYTLANLASGDIKSDDPATVLSKSVDKVTVEHMLRMSHAIRRSASKGELPAKSLRSLDGAPGFSWVDPDKAAGALAPAVAGLVERHGDKVLTDRRARRGDSGLANTLRAVDDILGRRDEIPGLDKDLGALKAAGHLKHLSTFVEGRKKEASAMAKKANMMDKTAAHDQDLK